MNIIHLIIAAWFILWGLTTVGLLAVPQLALGILAIIAGVALIVSGIGVWRKA